MTTATEIEDLLRKTTMPAERIRTLVDGASALWLATNTAPTLAADLALCYPDLRPNEVRARAADFAGTDAWRLAVLAHDRRGLLADITAVFAGAGLSISSAAGGAWPALGVALLTFAIHGPPPTQDAWQQLGGQLRTIGTGERPTVTFVPQGPVAIEVTTDEQRWLLHIEATDQVGLLWCICSVLASAGLDIQAVNIGETGGVANDLFVIDGEPDIESLRRSLSP